MNLLFGELAPLPPLHNHGRGSKAHSSRTAKKDHLGYWPPGNGLSNRPLYCPHTLLRWHEACVAQGEKHRAMHGLLASRCAWLKALLAVRTGAVLVESISPQHCQGGLLRQDHGVSPTWSRTTR